MHFDSDHSDQVSGAIYFAYPAIGDIKVHRSGKRKGGQWNGPWVPVTIRPPQWQHQCCSHKHTQQYIDASILIQLQL